MYTFIYPITVQSFVSEVSFFAKLEMNDDYSHLDSSLIYITESVPGPASDSLDYRKLIECFNSQLTNRCNCANICKPQACNCCEESGGGSYFQEMVTQKILLKKCKMDDINFSPIIECNDMCSCKESCGNRVVQYGPAKGLLIKTCKNPLKGLGLFTKDFISRGTFICEYAGEIITKAEVTARQNYNTQKRNMNYIFCLNEHYQSDVIQTFVDPSYMGNIGRYINHSCDPNSVIIPVRVNTPIPKLAIFSCRDIQPHTEITFQYGSLSPKDSVSLASIERKTCLCNSPICSGVMPYEVY